MRVFRAVGEVYDPTGMDAYRAHLAESEAVFVAPSEEQAIAWALLLWYRAPKRAVQVLEVSCIRNPMTLEVLEECVSHGYLEEFVPAGDGGFHIIHHNVELFEAVVLPADIIREVSCW